ncbi:hypothetical protein NMY22_g2183 [Coprinellus aureogranulatus]|nr:hypothetical protein NMY22_g2183 [Coprinellus aureogranulatus]
MPRSSSTSSTSSSDSRTPSPQNTPLLGSFDPFAVHPFTNFSGPSNHGHHGYSNQVHVLPHPSTLHMDAPATGPHGSLSYPSHSSQPYHQPSSHGTLHHPTAVPAGSGYYSQASQTPSHSGPSSPSSYKPIFVPFRQETSSPDLSDVLRRGRTGY